jgi:hypothetical protein
MGRSVSTSAALPELQRLAESFGVHVHVRAVPSIQDWCKAEGLEEHNPFLCGKALWDGRAQRHLVLLADPITPEMQSSVISGMQVRGGVPAEDISLLADGRVFLKHLLLHEMGHVLDHDREEVACDLWAFEQLRSGA